MPSYQYENMYTAYYAIKAVIPDFEILPKYIRLFNRGLSEWGFMGRYTVVALRPKVVLDSAHNYQGLEKLMNEIQGEKYKRLHVVMGVVNDKDLNTVWPLFPSEAQYYFCQARIPRALDKDELRGRALEKGFKGESYSSVKRALAAARKKADTRDLILVCGSIFTVAEVI